MVLPKFKIYKDVICLEMPSRTGGAWWYQGMGLGFTPWKIEGINSAKYTRLHGSGHVAGRETLVVQIPIAGVMQWVAVNLPRSDIPALKRRGFWDNAMQAPYDEAPPYADYPESL